MLALTTWTGGLLVATGVIAYVATDAVSLTALIPAAFGVLLLIAALIGRSSETARKHAMHAGLVVALVGALGALMNVVKIGDHFAGTAERPGAIIASTVMFVLLVVFLVAGVRSFVKARAAR
jgi:nucleoside recognition membrane protein YjiH